MAGYNDNINVNTLYLTKLVDRMRTDIKKTANKITNPANWGKEGERLKFDAVVGNPPYQETVRLATDGNNNNTVDIYPYFRKAAINVANIVSLIYPAKELQRGKENLLDENLVKVRIHNGSAKEAEKNIPGEPSVFGEAVRRIPGDVGVFLWNMNEPTEKVVYQEMVIDRTDKIMPVRKEFFELAKKLEGYADSAKDYSIRKCCESNFVQQNPSAVLSLVSDRNEPVPIGFTKVITNDKAGSGGKAKWYYIKTDCLDYVQDDVYKVVISSAFPNEAFKNPNNIEVLNRDEMFGRTKKCIYYSDDINDANNYVKYLHTFFVKVIVEMTPYKFLYYLPDFDDIKKEIDWTKSVQEIDLQLFEKFGLSSDEYENLKSFF